MQHAYGLDIPLTLEDACDPARMALIVYDMRVGVVNQIAARAEITSRVLDVLERARAAGVRVLSPVTCRCPTRSPAPSRCGPRSRGSASRPSPRSGPRCRADRPRSS